jgi:hypothetical protein
MPINPSDILPRRQVPEIATGPITGVGVGTVTVQIRPDLSVVVATSQVYAVGQMVSVAIPGGVLASAQILSGASGTAPRIRQVVV